MKSLHTNKDKQKRLRREVDNPMSQPKTINAFDVIKFEHDTYIGKGGLHNLIISNVQQSLGMSDDNRYSEEKGASTITDCGVNLLESSNNTCTAGLFINMRAGSSAIRL